MKFEKKNSSKKDSRKKVQEHSGAQAQSTYVLIQEVTDVTVALIQNLAPIHITPPPSGHEIIEILTEKTSIHHRDNVGINSVYSPRARQSLSRSRPQKPRTGPPRPAARRAFRARPARSRPRFLRRKPGPFDRRSTPTLWARRSRNRCPAQATRPGCK